MTECGCPCHDPAFGEVRHVVACCDRAYQKRPTTVVEDGRVILYAEGVRFDLTDDAQKVIWAMARLSGTSSLDRVSRAAQDIGNEFAWFDSEQEATT